MKAATIRQKREALVEENAKINPREQAERLGISEGAMVASECGNGTVRLKRDVRDLSVQLSEWACLGEVLSVSRNRAALLEVQGKYPKCQFFEGLGWMQGDSVDLHILKAYWSEGFYVPTDGTRGASFQYFDGDGMAVHKVFFPQGQEPEEKWIKRQQHRNQKPDFEWTRDPLSGYSGEEPSEVDHQQLMKKWEALAEMHNMTRLMQRFQLTRLQLIRLVGEDWAQRLNRDALRRGLEQAGREGYSIELTLENSGVRHIRRGLLPQVTSYGKWLNLLEGSFNLHIDESQINQVWRVKVPTRNGPVHVLEVFDKGDRPVLRFLADDALTMKEPAAWAEMIKTCEPLSIEE